MPTAFNRVACLRPQPSDNDNRIIVEWEGNSYAVNQRTLNRYANGDELKAALDKWTQLNLGYVIPDVWFHKNRDGTWAIATGEAPMIWPEDRPAQL